MSWDDTSVRSGLVRVEPGSRYGSAGGDLARVVGVAGAGTIWLVDVAGVAGNGGGASMWCA